MDQWVQRRGKGDQNIMVFVEVSRYMADGGRGIIVSDQGTSLAPKG
jgi:hypothetical protein